MASCFKSWLSEKLSSLNSDVDLEVFVSYITGILETDSSVDDKKDSLLDIITEILPADDVTEHCTAIIDKWNELLEHSIEQQAASAVMGSIDTTIHSIIEQQTAAAAAAASKASASGDTSHKQAILAQYAEVSDGEETDSEAEDSSAKSSSAAAASGSSDLLVKNMNAMMVKERERNERERAKHESEVKKQKDKDDREKQKQKLQERKDNEKKRTQKSEKKR